MDFDEYFKKMCGNPEDIPSSNFKVNGTTSPFNKQELRWLKNQLESVIEWDDPSTQNSKKINYKKMLKKVEERINLL